MAIKKYRIEQRLKWNFIIQLLIVYCQSANTDNTSTIPDMYGKYESVGLFPQNNEFEQEKNACEIANPTTPLNHWHFHVKTTSNASVKRFYYIWCFSSVMCSADYITPNLSIQKIANFSPFSFKKKSPKFLKETLSSFCRQSGCSNIFIAQC